MFSRSEKLVYLCVVMVINFVSWLPITYSQTGRDCFVLKGESMGLQFTHVDKEVTVRSLNDCKKECLITFIYCKSFSYSDKSDVAGANCLLSRKDTSTLDIRSSRDFQYDLRHTFYELSRDEECQDRDGKDWPSNERPPYGRPPGERPSFDRPPLERPPYDRPSNERPSFDRPPLERPPYDRPPLERPPYDRPPDERPPYDRPSNERPPFDRPSNERPPYDRPPLERPPYDRPPLERPPYDRPPLERPPYDRPPDERPAYERPPFDRPSNERPSFDRPSNERPPFDRPPFERPPYDRPSDERPSYDRPSNERPPYDRPSVERPPYDRPSIDRPPYDRPSIDRPPYDRPSIDRPPYDRPANERPPYDRPSNERPPYDWPSAERPSYDRPSNEIIPSFGRPSFAESSEDNVCFWRTGVGRRLAGAFIQKRTHAIGVRDCKDACLRAPFICRGFNYKLSSQINNCELSNKETYNLNTGDTYYFPRDPDYDYYERNSFQGVCRSNNSDVLDKDGYDGGGSWSYVDGSPWSNGDRFSSEGRYDWDRDRYNRRNCFRYYRKAARLTRAAVKYTVKANDYLDCVDACLRYQTGFSRCKTIAFSYYTIPVGTWFNNGKNCQISDRPATLLSTYNQLVYDPSYDVYTIDDHSRYCAAADDRYPGGDYGDYGREGRTETASGLRCHPRSYCQRDPVGNYYYCQTVDGGWDFCCRPGDYCHSSRGFSQKWCYVGIGGTDKWRPCNMYGGGRGRGTAYLKEAIPEEGKMLKDPQQIEKSKAAPEIDMKNPIDVKETPTSE